MVITDQSSLAKKKETKKEMLHSESRSMKHQTTCNKESKYVKTKEQTVLKRI